ncbi:MAG: LON peptidase substrate-binding domain-containing protein [Bacteroidetes bacterium]|nr:LON peptidase substrate-binding domain-containing protein [Bacteroidota bacterium]
MIPLFPLNVVVCPGEELALHIFEDRYREMIRLCISETRPFGIILVHDSAMMTVGCTVKISQVLKVFDDGRMDILTEGQQRFTLLSTDRRKSYLQATVDYFSDEPGEPDSFVTEEAIRLHKQLLSLAGAPADEKTYEKRPLSFSLAHSAGLDLEDKQKLLEDRSEPSRLLFLIGHLTALIDKIRYYEEVKKMVRANGHARFFPPIDLTNLGTRS